MIKNFGSGGVRHNLQLGHRDVSATQVAESDSARLLLTIGQAVYEFEESVKKSSRTELELSAPRLLVGSVDLNHIARTLERLISYVLLTDASVSIVPSTDQYQATATELINPVTTVSLFSGGVDSLSGTLLAAHKGIDLSAVFCSHLYQGRVISITRRLGETYLRRHGVDLFEIPAPSMKVTGYSQTRGFLYVLSAAAVGVWSKARRIVVSECGPTMFQPKFGPADQTTMTTHPFILSRAQEIIDAVASRLVISTPFENLTKAEVMAVCPKPRAFPKTHSCVSQRMPLHDGTCYGCVVRRLAALASASPDVAYAKNPLRDNSANSGNLLSLLNFNLNFLRSPRNLPSYQHEMIYGNRKGPLFKRFALDNFAALHKLRMQRIALAPAVDSVYREALTVFGGANPMIERLRALTQMKSAPPRITF